MGAKESHTKHTKALEMEEVPSPTEEPLFGNKNIPSHLIKLDKWHESVSQLWSFSHL